MFSKQIQELLQNSNNENLYLSFMLNLTIAKGQLASDKIPYQMVGLCDDDKALTSYVKHIWLPLCANSKM